ncbi:MAG: OmpA family protein [Fluviicola sp.]|nr:OmpA family protein [Fluviicola sp.]
MNKALLVIFSFFIFSVGAEVKLISFYFDSDTLTSSSQEILNDIIEKQNLNEFQIIEMNAYAKSIDKSCRYAESILSQLALNPELINLNCSGSKREFLSFRPRNWNRVDVYYFLGELIASVPPVIEVVKKEAPPKEEKIEEIVQIEDVAPRIIENTPVVLPIKFKGGTADVLASSTIYLEELYELLNNNKEYNATIKGHVCCENNKRMSKKRAKVVFEYLIGKGINEERLSFEGLSNLSPIVFPEKSEKDRARNRRVEVVFFKTL